MIMNNEHPFVCLPWFEIVSQHQQYVDMTYHIVSSAASSVNRLSFMYHHNALCIIVYHHNTLLNQVTAMIAYHGLACPYLRLHQYTDDMS